ncbi:hypothetical protein JRI60_47645 [Archangium violaceum]|uniref:hypothetical protein n=1 Tax=Archangium violaceum TaxID=83451 RepID=UPI00194E7F06|nr:hypothetical protein [Archangium violaceum]QRN96594.1 hypothetical protein JRI60_47645 [Archangium violaceum]
MLNITLATQMQAHLWCHLQNGEVLNASRHLGMGDGTWIVAGLEVRKYSTPLGILAWGQQCAFPR